MSVAGQTGRSSDRPWLIGTGAFFCAVALAALTGSFALWTGIFLWLLAGLAWSDLRTQTVPDGLTLALVLSGLAHGLSDGQPMMTPLITAMALIAFGMLKDRISPDSGWFGSGDYFLIAGLITWLGYLGTFETLIFSFFFLCIHAILQRSVHVALAPSLAIASTFHWLGGPTL